MATKIKKNGKISVGDLERAVKDSYDGVVQIEWNGLDITVKKNINLAEMMVFVESVVKACFDTNAAYHPEMKDFATRIAVVELYSNLSLPSGLPRVYDIVYCSDIVDVIFDRINTRQFAAITSAIDYKIDNIANSNVEAINRQINSMNDSLESLGNQFSGLFDGVNPDDIQKVMGAIGENGLDEEKLLRTYMDITKDNDPKSKES